MIIVDFFVTIYLFYFDKLKNPGNTQTSVEWNFKYLIVLKFSF